MDKASIAVRINWSEKEVVDGSRDRDLGRYSRQGDSEHGFGPTLGYNHVLHLEKQNKALPFCPDLIKSICVLRFEGPLFD